ncbi:MAG TPA: hypothetical protein DDW65_10335 [Firmicutes bacterium]|jgi:galactitol PTS system EIIC component|nr:hypothetical protein [Bacillota bacterium]
MLILKNAIMYFLSFQHFPRIGQTYIGLDVAVIFGIPSVAVTGILLIPVALVGAFILPGINFIPLGDLTNLLVPAAFVVIATRGNIIRSFIIGVPIVLLPTSILHPIW